MSEPVFVVGDILICKIIQRNIEKGTYICYYKMPKYAGIILFQSWKE